MMSRSRLSVSVFVAATLFAASAGADGPSADRVKRQRVARSRTARTVLHLQPRSLGALTRFLRCAAVNYNCAV